MGHPTIYRYEVPVDYEWHVVPLSGKIISVAARRPYDQVLEFWAFANSDHQHDSPREFRVFGTGDQLPDETRPQECHGSVIVNGGLTVWHLVERH